MKKDVHLSTHPRTTGRPLGFGLVLLLGAACGEPAENVGAVTARADDGEIHENQGTSVLGIESATLSVKKAGVKIAGEVIISVSAEHSNLTIRPIFGSAFSGLSVPVGTQFTASDGATLTIKKVCKHYAPPRNWLPPPNWSPKACVAPEAEGWKEQDGEYEYEIEVKPSKSTVVKPFCAGGWNRAVAMEGTWNENAQHLSSTTDFSFVCMGGTARKCSDWGYKPWDSAATHQACTRMARADYCGDDRSHTIEGTPIDAFDWAPNDAPINGQEQDSAFSFEGGWLPKGALCLAKARWALLPPNYCKGTVPDPRHSLEASPCDSAEEAQNAFLGLPLPRLPLNNSGYYEAGLYTWHNADADRRYTTSSGYFGGVNHVTGDSPEANYDTAEYEGIVFTSKVANTRPLFSCTDGNKNYVTTAGACPPPFNVGEPVVVGYIFYPAPQATGLPAHLSKLLRPLRRICRDEPTDCITTTRDAAAMPADYNFSFPDEGRIIVFRPLLNVTLRRGRRGVTAEHGEGAPLPKAITAAPCRGARGQGGGRRARRAGGVDVLAEPMPCGRARVVRGQVVSRGRPREFAEWVALARASRARAAGRFASKSSAQARVFAAVSWPA